MKFVILRSQFMNHNKIWKYAEVDFVSLLTAIDHYFMSITMSKVKRPQGSNM